MILIVSDYNDVHANIVEEKLLDRGNSVFRLNLDVQSLKKTIISYNGSNWNIEQNGSFIDQEQISVIWFRRAFVELLLEEQENRDVNFLIWKNEWNKVLLGFYLSISKKPTLCPLRQSYATENKFFQFNLAKEVGLSIPQYIVSNNKNYLQQFALSKEDNVVLKLHNQEFYQVGDVFKGIYVNKISSLELAEFQDKGENPITLQQYIDKKYEVRCTVVGEQCFGCKIESQKSEKAKVDWRRYDIPNTPHYPIEIPIDIQRKISALFSKLGINFGALDFIVDINDHWYFLEVNSMGQWLWIEDLTGLAISDAVTNWLSSYANKEY